MYGHWLIIAQETTPPAAPSPATWFLPAAMIALVVFMILTSRSQRRREERDRNQMFAKLSKNDRVVTIGGIKGTILAVRDKEVVLKVDETTNTKMTFIKSAIQRLDTDEPETASDKK